MCQYIFNHLEPIQKNCFKWGLIIELKKMYFHFIHLPKCPFHRAWKIIVRKVCLYTIHALFLYNWQAIEKKPKFVVCIFLIEVMLGLLLLCLQYKDALVQLSVRHSDCLVSLLTNGKNILWSFRTTVFKNEAVMYLDV